MGDAYRKGNLLFQQGRYKLAIEQFQLELQEFPQSAVAHSMLALALKNDNQKRAALAAAKEGLRLDAELAFGYYAMAWAQMEAEQPRARIGFRRNAKAYRRKQLKVARSYTHKAMELEPHNPEFYWLVGALEFDLRRPFPALEQVYRGLAIDPRYTKLSRLQILCFRRLLMFKRALAAADAVLAMTPEDADVHRHRGWLLLGQRSPRAAHDSFIRSLQLDASSKDAQRGLRWCRYAKWPLGKFVAQIGVELYGGNGRQYGIIIIYGLVLTASHIAAAGLIAIAIIPVGLAMIILTGFGVRKAIAAYRFRRLCKRLGMRSNPMA